MDHKKHLRSFLDNLVQGDTAAASASFAKYLTPKTISLISEGAKQGNLAKALEKSKDRADKAQKENLKSVEDVANQQPE